MANDSRPTLWPLKLAIVLLVAWNLALQIQVHRPPLPDTMPSIVSLQGQELDAIGSRVAADEERLAAIEGKLGKHGW